MVNLKIIGVGLVLSAAVSLACGGADEEPQSLMAMPTATAASTQTAAAVLEVPPTATPAPALEPTAAAASTYTVESGDYPSLIAEKLGIQAGQQNAWIAAMLALNNTDATALQVGQVLALPGSTAGPAPAAAQAAATSTPSGSGAAAAEPTATEVPVQATNTQEPVATIAEATATSTPAPTATPQPASDGGPWYVSSHHSAEFYYCQADQGWQGLSLTYLQVYNTEAELLAAWGGRRVKHADSVC